MIFAWGLHLVAWGQHSEFVDPKIGSEGLGRVFIGPSMPFGMVKPGPCCTHHHNSGWAPMPEQVDGFAQVHVSGTGGGPKYGNVLVQPFADKGTIAHRKYETIELGYYETTYEESGIRTQVTTADRCSMYKFSYPRAGKKRLLIDAGFFLGESDETGAREAQELVGSEVEVVSDRAVRGYSRVRGGWNNGGAYTVYFYAETDESFSAKTYKKAPLCRGGGMGLPDSLSLARMQSDTGDKTGAVLEFASDTVRLRVGISFVSTLRAKENIVGMSFEEARAALVDEWEALLSRIEVWGADSLKRMFYTGLYHTMQMPTDRTGENPLWAGEAAYYDDFYAIWDTYRSSMPLITLIDPQRQAEIVASLIDIGRHEGYMPDARSGNCNGRTQGGSNAEIVVADAMAKGLEGIDYEAGLAAMLRDATEDPGLEHEKHGRGGLDEYLRYGYIPHGIDRAGNRTMEYAHCDYAIAQVARRLGREDIYERYLRQSGNWKNLWRGDYEAEGVRGFIMPRDAKGAWIDTVRTENGLGDYVYHTTIYEGPWYTPWWGMFFYEGTSWEYSLSVPHDVEGLIELCGGAEAFEARLDKFFGKNYYNVNNEPSFLTPCLYHWVGRPDKSTQVVRDIITQHYGDGAGGLPGNDDSGAMSSFLAFHLMGLYPLAGEDRYLVNTPMLDSAMIEVGDGKRFMIKRGERLALNGEGREDYFLRHGEIMSGGCVDCSCDGGGADL